MNTPLPPESLLRPLAERLGWTLLHSLWQGAVITAALAAALWILRRRSAAARHAACLLALPAMTVAATVTLLRMEPGTAVPTLGSAAIAPAVSSGFQTANPGAATTARALSAKHTPIVDAPRIPASSMITAAWRERLERCLPWVSTFWVTGVLLLSLRQAGGWLQVGALRRGGVPARPVLQESFAHLCTRFRLHSGTVRLLETAQAGVPMLMGLFRPVVLLPAQAVTGLSAAQLEAILAHELAHLVRLDAWSNLALIAVETTFFYHPAVWWIGRRVREERELAADDLALRVCADRRLYAGALARLVEFQHSSPAFALASTGDGGRGSLLHRIRRIVQPTAAPASSAPAAAWSLLLLLAAVSVGLPWATRVRAQEPKVNPKEEVRGQGELDAQTRAMQEKVTAEQVKRSLEIQAKAAEAAKAVEAAKATDAAKAAENAKAAEAAKAVEAPTPTPAATVPDITAQDVDDVRVARLSATNRRAARVRAAQDQQFYSPEQLREIETLYQVANTKGIRNEESRASLRQLLDKYDKANRTGCATLYYGQGSQGPERLEYLARAVENFSDCYYFNGCQVGGYGRYLLAFTLWEAGEKEKARALIAELRTTYKDATDHHGRPITELAAEAEKAFAETP